MTEAPTVVRYEPRGAAVELFRGRDLETVISGPAGTGKSVACLMRMHLAALNNPGFRGLIVRKTAASLGSTTLVTYKEKVASEAIAQGIVTWYGGSTKEAACWRYHRNGAVAGTIVVGGMDKPAKIMSSEYDLIFADEATELTINDWEAMRTRLRNGRRSRQQLMGACNPDSEHHWINQRGTEGRLRLLYSTHKDNPAYVNRDGTYTDAGRSYVEGTLAGLTGIRRARLYEGKWTSAEGVVYPGWDPAVHMVDGLPKGSETWTRWWSVDFGFSNPMVIQFWAEDSDGRLWLYREIYRTKRLVEDHALDALATVRRPRRDIDWKKTNREPDPKRPADWEWTEPKPRAIICDHDAEDRATLERHLGMSTKAARKTVKNGVQAVQSRLKVQANGRPRLYVVRHALVSVDKELEAAKKPLSTEQEITGYVWPEDVKPDQREVPVKKDDHGCLVAGTLVATALGARPIEQIQPGDMVHTRSGLRAVAASGMTSAQAIVYEVRLSSGATLTGTGNHPVLVSGKGWTRLDALRYADTLIPCQTWNQCGLTASPSVDIPALRTGQSASTSAPVPPTECAGLRTSTAKSGSRRTDQYRPTAKSTTSTSTRSTTSWRTWLALPWRTIRKRTASADASVSAPQSSKPTSIAYARLPQPGTVLTRAVLGIASMQRSTALASPSCGLESANSAAPNTKQHDPARVTASVPAGANRHGVAPVASITSSVSAPAVRHRSSSTATPAPPVADVHVLSVCELVEAVPVFNLTVTDVPEFFADGVLVHNCDAMRYMVADRDLGVRPGVRVVR